MRKENTTKDPREEQKLKTEKNVQRKDLSKASSMVMRYTKGKWAR